MEKSHKIIGAAIEAHNIFYFKKRLCRVVNGLFMFIQGRLNMRRAIYALQRTIALLHSLERTGRETKATSPL